MENGKSQSGNVIIDSAKITEFRATIRIHTSIIPLLLLIVFAVTLMQSLDVWKGEMWRFHHDFVSPEMHQWAIDLSETLGEEHLLTGYYAANKPLDSDHPHHHSNIEKVISSHWQNDILTWVLHLNMILILTCLLRCYFYLKRQTHFTMVLIMWILLVSTIAQILAMILRFWILFTYVTFWSVLGTTVNGLLLLMEIATLQDIYEIRRLTMYLALVMRNVKVPDEQSIGSSVRGKVLDPVSWLDTISTFLVSLGDNMCLYQQRRQRQKID